MGYTARAESQQEHDHANDDEAPARVKLHVLPSGKRSFIRRDSNDPDKRAKPRPRGRKEWPPGKVISVANLYLSDIHKKITGLYGGPCDTDEGEIYLRPALRIMILRFNAMKHDGRNPKPVDAYAWAKRWTPRLAAEHGRAWFDEMQDRLIRELELNPAPLPSADELAHETHTTHAQVVAFRLRAIGAVNRPAAQRQAEEKAKRATRERGRRVKKKTIPRSESMAQTKPWEAYGVSEPTFRRWVRDGKVPPHPTQKKARTATR